MLTGTERGLQAVTILLDTMIAPGKAETNAMRHDVASEIFPQVQFETLRLLCEREETIN